MKRINLTDEDIAANRQGRLSDGQRRRVQRQRLIWIGGTVGVVGIGMGLTAVLLLKWRFPTFANRGELFIVVPLLLVWLWLLRHMPRRWRRANRDLRTGQVTSSEGPVQTDLSFGVGIFRSARYHVYLKDHAFRVPQAVQRAFHPGRPYRIYHTAHAHQFLGALPLVEERDDLDPPLALVDPLTRREQEVLQLIATGLSNRQIADQLSLSVNTIKMYASQLYKKLGVNRRTEAIARAQELDLL